MICDRQQNGGHARELHPMVRTVADCFPAPRAGDLAKLHKLQQTRQPASGAHSILRETMKDMLTAPMTHSGCYVAAVL